MPSGDRDVVQRLIDHWEVGEFAPALSHLHPDVAVVNQVSGAGFEGYGGVRRLIGDWEQAFSDWSLKMDEMLDCTGGRYLVVGRIASTGKKTGGELDRPVALLFALEDGLIVRVDAFVNRLDEAYAAAGLEPEGSS
jgi:ketosteroid isomerase-like protein